MLDVESNGYVDLKIHRLSSGGMRERQTKGVEAEALKFPAASLRVADDGMPDKFAMDAEVVGAACYRFEFDGGRVGVSCTHPEPLFGGFAVIFNAIQF